MILNQYIKQEGISVSKFAKKWDIPLPTMSKYYYGEKIPRLVTPPPIEDDDTVAGSYG